MSTPLYQTFIGFPFYAPEQSFVKFLLKYL